MDFHLAPVSARIHAWRNLGRTLVAMNANNKPLGETLLRFQIALESIAAASSKHKQNPALQTALAAISSQLDVDPFNPDWPGRDRLFFACPHSAAEAFASLAAVGYFQAEAVPELALGPYLAVPGLEADLYDAETALTNAIASAKHSFHDKKVWRNAYGQVFGTPSSEWEATPYVWKTFFVADAAAVDWHFWDKVKQSESEELTGLTLVLCYDEGAELHDVGELKKGGWDVVSLTADKLEELYLALREKQSKPLVAMIELKD